MDASHNWLAFSLSNHQRYLFEALSSAPPHGGVEVTEEERGGAAELAALAGVGPKLEDFLGGCGEPMGRYSGGDAADAAGIYDSELKHIAAGFLQGIPAAMEQQDSEAAKAVAPAESRKAVDTFGQRTSIYRGVTRSER